MAKTYRIVILAGIILMSFSANAAKTKRVVKKVDKWEAAYQLEKELSGQYFVLSGSKKFILIADKNLQAGKITKKEHADLVKPLKKDILNTEKKIAKLLIKLEPSRKETEKLLYEKLPDGDQAVEITDKAQRVVKIGGEESDSNSSDIEVEKSDGAKDSESLSQLTDKERELIKKYLQQCQSRHEYFGEFYDAAVPVYFVGGSWWPNEAHEKAKQQLDSYLKMATHMDKGLRDFKNAIDDCKNYYNKVMKIKSVAKEINPTEHQNRSPSITDRMKKGRNESPVIKYTEKEEKNVGKAD